MRTGHKGELPSRHQIPDIDARDTSRSGSAQAALGDLLRVCNRLADRWTQEDQESLTRRVARWGNISAAGKTDALAADTGTAQKLLRSLCKACQTQRAGAMAGTLQLLTSELATLIKSMPTPVVERWDAELLEQLVRTLNECDWSAASSQTSREISEILIARRDPGVNDFSILLMVGSKLFNESKGIARQLKERRTHPTKFSALVNNRQRMLEQLRTRGWPEGAPDALKVKDIAGGALAVRGLLKSGLAAHFPEKSNQVVMAWLELLLAGSQYLGPVDIASALTSIEAVVKDKTTALRENPEVKAQLEKALPVLLQLTCSKDFWTNAKPQEITNALYCIKAVVQDETTKLRENPKVKPQLEKALLVLLQLTCSNDFRTNAEPQHIANALNCIKAVIEDETTKLRENPKVRAQLEKALLVLLQLTCSPNFGEKEDFQAIANALNCIKAVVQDETTKLRENPKMKPQLEKALLVLLQLTCSNDFRTNAEPQHIANALNCIKAVIEDETTKLRENPKVRAQLEKALLVLLQLTCSPNFGEKEDPQAIANALNCIKAVIEDETTKLREDSEVKAQLENALPVLLQLTCLLNVGEKADPRHIANALNCIKAVVEDDATGLRDHDAVQAQLGQALPVLLRATCTNAFRVEADSQAVANVLFDLHVLQGRSQPFVATHAQVLADSARAMLALACLGRVDAMHPIHRCQLRIALRSLTEQEVLKAGDHAVQVMMRALYQRMSEQGPQVDGLKPNALGNRIWLCAQLHASGLMSSEDFDGLAPVFASQVGRLLALPAGQTKADVAARLWLLESAARLHGKLVRSSPDEAAMLDEAVLTAAQAMDWPRVAELQLRTQMGDCCFALTRVMDRLRTNDARRQPWEAAIVSAARALAPLISVGEVKFTEANVILRFVPEAEWTSLRIPAMGLARQREIVYAAWKSLKNNPVPMTSSKPIELPVLRDNGRPVLKDGKPKSLTYESLVHQELFGDQFTPLLVELPKYVRPGTVPLVVKHNGRLYRTELFRGSKNKPEEGELPQLICVPVESGEFFANWWVTSKESRTYAQRAFLNGQVGKAQAANDKAAQSQGAGGLKGRFGVAVVPDDKAAQFVPKGPSQHLRVRDGCGFIKRSLAEQLVGRKQLAKQLELACVNGKPSDKGLSGQALHHYPVRPEQAKAIAQEFLGHAKRQLMQPLKASRIPPEPATLAHANAMGRAPIFHRKAVPSADQKLRLPDTPEWRKRAAEGVIVTRPPQDTENLLFVPRGDIEFVPPTLVLQHSLTGYRKVPREGDGLLQEKAREFHERQQEMGKQQGIEVPENEEWLQSLFFKGQLVIVDDDDWPENFSKQQIVVSAKDLKTSNLMDSLDTKKKMQNPQEISTFKMRGCLAFKQLNVGVAVPEKMQADLGGDYDGDDLGILSAAEFPELTKLVIERQPHKRRNAKMPKSFTLALQGEWDVTKIEQILSGLTGKSAVASRAYYAAPQALVDPLYQDEDFLQGEIVQDLMELVEGNDPWHVKAGWKDDIDLANHVHARLLLERELELLEKAGTDLEKTDLPVPLLVERCKAYMKKLQEHGQVAWGKGLEENLKAAKAEWAFAAGDDERAGDPSAGTSLEELRDAYAEVLLAMREHTRTQRGLPAAITMAIMDWYLEGLTPRLAADATVLSLSPVSSIDDAARALRQEGELRLEASPDLHEELPDPMVVDASAGQSSASNKQRAVRQADLDWVNQIRTTSMPPELLLNPASRDAGDPADDLRDLDEELPEEDPGRVMGIADVDDLPGWVIRTSDELAALKGECRSATRWTNWWARPRQG